MVYQAEKYWLFTVIFLVRAISCIVCYFHKYNKGRAVDIEQFEQKLNNGKPYSQTDQFVECICQVRTN